MAKPADFFIDPMRMELALGVLTLWFAAFGYDGKTTGSLNATLRNIANWGQSARAHARLRVKHHLRPHGMLVHLATAAPQGYLLLGAIRIRDHGRAQKQLVHHPQDRALGRRWRAGTAP